MDLLSVETIINQEQPEHSNEVDYSHRCEVSIDINRLIDSFCFRVKIDII
jgi:hypothetical protein